MKKRGGRRTIVLSLGGSIIMPGKINVRFLKRFRSLINSRLKKDKFIIVAGGGKVCRDYIKASKTLGCKKQYDTDMIGIKATNLNSELIRVIFRKHAYKEVVLDYSKKTSFKDILVCSGYLPGTSTDYDAVMFAIRHGSKTVINLSNIEYVYTKDPNRYKNAKRIKDIRWEDFIGLVGKKFRSGMHLPFDPVATMKAKNNDISVVMLKGTDIKNLKRFLEGKRYRGTIVHN